MKVVSKKLIRVDNPVPVYDVVNARPYHNFIVKTNKSHIVSHNCGFLDEVNFYNRGTKTTDPSKFMETGVMKVYTAVRRRIESRFMMMGKVPGLLILVSSAKNETDPLAVYIDKNRDNPTVRVVDEPQWVIKNTPGRYSGETFKLLVGDKYRSTQIVGPDEDWKSYEKQGRKILDVPIEHYDAFRLDADKALTDIAGISLVSGSKFINAPKYLETIVEGKTNAFTQDIVEMGMRDGVRLEEFFDLDRFTYSDKRRALYVHWDASKTGDRTGLGLVQAIQEYTDVDRIVDGELVKVRDRLYDSIGAIGIQAPPGDEIPFRRIFEFILWLRTNGFRIRLVSMDSYQSVAILQDLINSGIQSKTVSLDRKPDGYLAFRSCIYEHRIKMFESPIIEKEVTELEQNAATGKVDHPSSGSKDISDGICGALWDAIQDTKDDDTAEVLYNTQQDIMDASYEKYSQIPDKVKRNRIRLDTQLFSDLDNLLGDDYDDYY